MYYYIIEPPKNYFERRQIARLKQLLGDLGITGELVYPSPARSINELAKIGVAKGYSTIIAVGQDLFINKTASATIFAQGEIEEPIAFGIIPVHPTSYFLDQIKVKTFSEATEILKFRRLASHTVGLIEPNKFFILPIKISQKKPFPVNVITKTFIMSGTVTEAIIDDRLYCQLVTEARGNWLTKLLARYDQKWTPTSFQADHIQIETEQPLPMVIDREVIAKTPASIRLVPDSLQLIVKRVTLSAE